MTGPVQEKSEFWRHACFHDLALMKARSTRHRYELHTHPTYVIALITEGCERIRIGHRTIIAPAGTIAIVNPEECHDGAPGADGGWAYRTFYPSVSLLTSIARELGQDRPPLFPRHLIEDSDLAGAMAEAHAGSTSHDATGAEATLLVALRRLILRYGDWNGTPERAESAGSRQRFLLYERIIEDDAASGLDLQRFAHAAGVTRFQVIRDFKKQTGLTPTSFIRNRRLRRAARLIEHGFSLAEAAVAAGFSDQSHLSRTFRATHGITPGAFQRSLIS